MDSAPVIGGYLALDIPDEEMQSVLPVFECQRKAVPEESPRPVFITGYPDSSLDLPAELDTGLSFSGPAHLIVDSDLIGHPDLVAGFARKGTRSLMLFNFSEFIGVHSAYMDALETNAGSSVEQKLRAV